MDEEDSADCADHDTTMDNNTATAAESFVWGPSEQSYNTTPTALTGDHHLGSAKTGGWTAKSHAERRTKLTTLGTSRRAQGNHTRRSGVVEDRSAETTAFFFLFYVLGLFLYVRIEERKKEEWSKQ